MITKPKKLTPASIVSQKTWQGLPVSKKNSLRKMLPDKDKDGVPNKFDCRPKNRKRQEGFLSKDLAYLESHTHVTPKDYINAGAYGAVYSLDDTDELVVKMPIGAVNRRCETNQAYNCNQGKCTARKGIQDEVDIYNSLGLENKPLFIPTRAVSMGHCNVEGKSCIGLVRPKIKATLGRTATRPTKSQLERLRQNLISISRDGICLDDGLQIGIDSNGRPLQFDLGLVTQETPSVAFHINNDVWARYLLRINDLMYNDNTLNRARMLRDYGSVNPRGR